MTSGSHAGAASAAGSGACGARSGVGATTLRAWRSASMARTRSCQPSSAQAPSSSHGTTSVNLFSLVCSSSMAPSTPPAAAAGSSSAMRARCPCRSVRCASAAPR